MPECSHHNNIPQEVLDGIAESQAGSGRHRCVVCAYAEGITAGQIVGANALRDVESCSHGSIAPTAVLTALPPSQAGGGRHKCTVCAFQLGLEAGAVGAIAETQSDVETEKATHGGDAGQGDREGGEIYIRSRRYERSPRNRMLAIKVHGTICVGCRFNFDAFYGHNFARSFIEIHHLNPLAQGERMVNPITDLVPLCSNCHSMVHRSPPVVLPIADLRELIARARAVR